MSKSSSLSGFYSRADATPAPVQLLEVQIRSSAGIHGKKVKVAVSPDQTAIDIEWTGKEKVEVKMSSGSRDLSPTGIKDSVHRFSGSNLLVSGRDYLVEVREVKNNKRTQKLLATVEFSLVFPQSMHKRGRIFKLKQLIERAIVVVPTPSRWKTFLSRGKPQDPNEARFYAAITGILTTGNENIHELSGIDIAIAICETELLKEWLLNLSSEDLARHIGKLESKAKQKGIRQSDQIINVVTEIFTR